VILFNLVMGVISSFHIFTQALVVGIYRLIQELARTDVTVLIEGETGTGKELVARAIHAMSCRHKHPFMAVNCAELSESLMVSQLFGHKRGAFTGAIADHRGLFEAAHGGTLLLDEVGDIPLAIQASLLRVLQEREVTWLGETTPRKINIRILAATQHNLQEAVARGRFRADLLYRIRVGRLALPALRERREDISLLAQAFLDHNQVALGYPRCEVSPAAMRLLVDYAWPGNVRELRSAMECAVIGCRGTVIQPTDLPPEIGQDVSPHRPAASFPPDENGALLTAITQAGGNRGRAAHLLGISRATLYRRLSKLHLSLDTIASHQH
jgi:DNA-binding NtrC family response regulator